MTSRERLEAAVAHREPDSTPVFEYVLLSPLADLLLGRPCAADAHWGQALRELGWAAAVRRSAVDRVELAERLGHDLIYAVPNPLPTVGTTGGTRPAAARVGADPVAALRQRNLQAEAAPPVDDAAFHVYVCLQEEMARRGLDLPLLAPAYAHGVWTDTDLMATMALAPEVAHRHFHLATARSLARIERYLQLGIELIGVGGDFAGQRPMISPAMYADFIVPEVRALARRIHAGGARAVNASDGDLWPVLDDFLYGCQVDAYLEIDLHAGMDLRRLKAACGRHIALFGNLDCGNTLSFGTPEQVRAHVVDCLQAGLGDGGHVLCASNAITASVPLANYRAVVDAYRGFFGLPALAL